MNLIERYIFRRIAVLSLSALVATTVVVLITQVLHYVNILTDSGQEAAAFLQLALLLVPIMVGVVAPFAVLIGVTQVFNSMNADSEMAVMESSGVSHARMAKPVILFSALVSIALLVSANVVEPWANQQLRSVISDARGDLFQLAIQSGTFRQLDNNLYVQVAEQLPEGELAGIFIADSRDPATDLIYYARRGAVRSIQGGDVLLLADGEIHRKSKADGSVSIITFASYALSMADLSRHDAQRSFLGAKERGLPGLLWPDPNDKLNNSHPEDIREEIHRRLSEWLYPLAFGLIGFAYAGGAQSSREERLWSIAVATSIALLVRAGGYIASNDSGSSSVMAALCYAIPISAILAFGALDLSGRAAMLPRSVARLAGWFESTGLAASATGTARRLRSATLFRGARP